MRVYVFGANGMLGRYLVKCLAEHYTVIQITRKDLDLIFLEYNSLQEFLNYKGISSQDVIVNCAGVISQRNSDTEEMYSVNSKFPHLLSQVKDSIGCKVIHITTDCVFSGKIGNYDENSPSDCTDHYGKSKFLGEPPDITCIRTSIIGEEISNKLSFLEWVKSNRGKSVRGYTNHYWNGVTCFELSKQILDIIRKNLFWNGVRHIFSPRKVTKYDMVCLVNDIYNLGIDVQPYSHGDLCDRTMTSIYGPMVNVDITEQIKQLKIIQNNFDFDSEKSK